MTEILNRVRAALASVPRLDLHAFPIALSFVDGTLTLEGEVADIAAKKLALERAAALPEVSGIVDRLRVRPAQPMGDGEIRDLVRDALLQEPAFADFAVRTRRGARVEPVRAPPEARGALEVAVEDGVVTLNGQVPGLDDKRLAGVLAWWVPGSRDVINGIAVEPPEDDSDDLILDAVRLVLEKDPLVDASQTLRQLQPAHPCHRPLAAPLQPPPSPRRHQRPHPSRSPEQPPWKRQLAIRLRAARKLTGSTALTARSEDHSNRRYADCSSWGSGPSSTTLSGPSTTDSSAPSTGPSSGSSGPSSGVS